MNATFVTDNRGDRLKHFFNSEYVNWKNHSFLAQLHFMLIIKL